MFDHFDIELELALLEAQILDNADAAGLLDGATDAPIAEPLTAFEARTEATALANFLEGSPFNAPLHPLSYDALAATGLEPTENAWSEFLLVNYTFVHAKAMAADDEIVVTGTIIRPPGFDFNWNTYFGDFMDTQIHASRTVDINLPDIHTCGLPITPANGVVSLAGVNNVHAAVITDFLELLRSDVDNQNIVGSIPSQYHTWAQTTNFTLADLGNILSDITIISADLPNDPSTPERDGGLFNVQTHVLTIGNHNTTYSDIVHVLIHEALHAYIDLNVNLTNVIDHGQHGVTSQNHQDWFDEIVEDLIEKLQENVGDSLQSHANCS